MNEKKIQELILGQTTRQRIIPGKTNNNTMVIGTAGSGKSYHMIRPNILNIDTNMVIVDTDCNLYQQTKDSLKEKGYTIEVISFTMQTEDNVAFFPFYENMSKHDIMEITDILLHNSKCSEGYWHAAYQTMFQLAVQKMLRDENKTNWNFTTLTKIIKNFTYHDSDISALIPVAEIPVTEDIFRLIQLKLLACLNAYCIADNETQNSKVFCMDEMTNQTSKCALFLEFSMIDCTYDNLLAVIIHNICKKFCIVKSQLIIFFDELPRMFVPELYEWLVASKRAKITFILAIQSIDQLRKLYPYNWQIIVNACANIIYLGAMADNVTAKYLSALCDVVYGTQCQERSVFTEEEIATFPADKCIVIAKGERIKVDEKFSRNVS